MASNLLALPAELRNRIYQLTLVEAVHPDVYGVRSVVVRHDHRPKVPALLQTCRAIRAEALGIYYEGVTFDVFNGETTAGWLVSIGDDAKALVKRLRLMEFFCTLAETAVEWKEALWVFEAGLAVGKVELDSEKWVPAPPVVQELRRRGEWI